MRQSRNQSSVGPPVADVERAKIFAARGEFDRLQYAGGRRLPQMAGLIEERREALSSRLDQMRDMSEWHLFQNFVLGLLPHDGYTDVRPSAVLHDIGRDAVARTPDGKPCFVAVSFDGSLTKIKKDAKRWTDDPNREPAEVMLFVTAEAPQNTTTSDWVAAIRDEHKLELRFFNRETILSTAIREGVWRETCARLGIPGHRQGFVKVAPYERELVRRALHARPPEWLRQRVPLAEWARLSPKLRNLLILGKPGSGKTTTIFEQLELAQPRTVLVVESDLRESAQIEGLLDEAAGGAVIVFDDVHENHKAFVSLCTSLRARRHDAPAIAKCYQEVVLLAASRGQEWEQIRGEIPDTILQDLELLGDAEITIADMKIGQCRQLIEICRDEWKLVIEKRLLGQAAQAAAERDATPLLVISMLAAARASEDRTLCDEHLAGLPRNVRELWQRYWARLEAEQQGILRLVRLFWAANVPPQPQLLGQAAKFFEISPADLSAGLDTLERALWLTRSDGVPACLDVQLEVIRLDLSWCDRWDKFIFEAALEPQTRGQLHNGAGGFYYQQIVPRTSASEQLRAWLRAAVRHFEALRGGRAGSDNPVIASMSLNNASNVYSYFAGMETTREGRRGWLKKARSAVEESIAIRRELGTRGDLATPLNNASYFYIALADLETTREDRRRWLEQARAAVEESIAIGRELRVRGDLASPLNNASNIYTELAKLEVARARRRQWLERALEATQESTDVLRELGARERLAISLGTTTLVLSDLAALQVSRERRCELLEVALVRAEEAVAIQRRQGVRGTLAQLLNTASRVYLTLAPSEMIREGRRQWLQKGREAVEEAIEICRELGNRDILSRSLINASNFYCELADSEIRQEGRRGWLEKAREAVSEAVGIGRKLGLRSSLAVSLGAMCRFERSLADVSVDPPGATRHLRASRTAIDEALVLFRDIGDTPYLLLAMKEAVTARLLLGDVGEQIDIGELTSLVEEGLALGGSMQDEPAAAFFADLKRQLTDGDLS